MQNLPDEIILIIELAVTFAVIIILNYVIISFIIRTIQRRISKKKGDILHEKFSKKMGRPLKVLVWITGLSYMLQFVLSFYQYSFDFYIFRDVVIVLVVGWLLFIIKNQTRHAYIKQKAFQGKAPDIFRIEVFAKIGTLTIIILTSMIALETLGVQLGALIAFGGVGGIAIGFAAKGVVSNFFGGIMIYLTHPFSVGDWISSPDKQLEGTVLEIGYYMTKIRSFDKRPIYVPNSIFSSSIIVNPSRMTNRRIKETIGVRYDDFECIRKILKEIKEMILSHPAIDTKQTILVNFNKYGDYTLDILIYTFTKTTVWKDWLDAQEDVLIKIGEIILANGAQIAFPTQTLDYPDSALKIETISE